MDKESALAVCFSNLKGSKVKDLIGTARALKYLKSLPDYKTNEKVGSLVGVSAEVVREFLSLLMLPPHIQILFEQKKLRGLEQARRLWQINRNRPELLDDVAEEIRDMPSWDARHIVDYLLRNPDKSVGEAKQAVIQSKTTVEHEYHVVAILPEEEYLALAAKARRKKISLDTLVTNIIKEWLSSGNG